jgi:hypothetical protein
MFKQLVLFLSVGFSSTVLAQDCGPKPQATKNFTTAYLECSEKQTNCLELKDDKGVVGKLDESSKLILKITSATVKKDIISFEFDKNSSCWFEKITGENVGKRLALVSRDTILTFPTIQAKISGGKVQISNDDATDLNLCKAIFEGCTLNSIPEPKPAKGGFIDKMTNPPVVNLKEINSRYGEVMESAYWVTDKVEITVYKNRDLKDGAVDKIPLMGEKKVPFFYGQQEYDKKTNKFIFTKDAILIQDYGWVKRAELAPYNVLGIDKNEKKVLLGYYVMKKCEAIIKKSMGEKFYNENLNDIYIYYRNSEVGLCATLGEGSCRSIITDMKNEASKQSCDGK